MAQPTIKQAGITHSSPTFEFVSGFPNLHMPHRRIDDAQYVNPNNAECLADGELVEEYWTSQGGVLIRKLTAANIDAAVVSNVYIFHGKRGRSDVQVSEGGPVVHEFGFEFRTKLHDPNQSILTAGTYVAPGIIAGNTDYPKVCGFIPAVALGPFVAVVLGAEGDGWVRLRAQRGHVPSTTP